MRLLDDNWRRWWWAHLLHFLQGWFTSSLVAGGWEVAAVLTFTGYALYQVVEYIRQGDTIVRDLKVYLTAVWVALALYFTTGWNVAGFIQGVL